MLLRNADQWVWFETESYHPLLHLWVTISLALESVRSSWPGWQLSALTRLFLTSLMLPLNWWFLISQILFARSLWHCLQFNFHPWSLQALSLIVQSQRLVGRFLHYLNVLLTYFLWRLTVARIQLHYLLPSLFARIPTFWGNIQVLFA